jgi:hypothetical protein
MANGNLALNDSSGTHVSPPSALRRTGVVAGVGRIVGRPRDLERVRGTLGRDRVCSQRAVRCLCERVDRSRRLRVEDRLPLHAVARDPDPFVTVGRTPGRDPPTRVPRHLGDKRAGTIVGDACAEHRTARDLVPVATAVVGPPHERIRSTGRADRDRGAGAGSDRADAVVLGRMLGFRPMRAVGAPPRGHHVSVGTRALTGEDQRRTVGPEHIQRRAGRNSRVDLVNGCRQTVGGHRGACVRCGCRSAGDVHLCAHVVIATDEHERGDHCNRDHNRRRRGRDRAPAAGAPDHCAGFGHRDLVEMLADGVGRGTGALVEAHCISSSSVSPSRAASAVRAECRWTRTVAGAMPSTAAISSTLRSSR